jgi:8-oxo-dGTP pyrophosphatase MutT (NUDIX family)
METSPNNPSNIKDKELHRIAITCIIHKTDHDDANGDAGSQHRYLVTKRSPHKKVHPGKWTVPGGGLTTDDYTSKPQTHGNAGWYGAVEACLLREIKEEVNVEIGKPTYLLDLTFIRPDGIPVLVLSYYAPYISGEVILDEDAVEYRWVTVAEAKELDLISGIYEEIEEVDGLIQ